MAQTGASTCKAIFQSSIVQQQEVGLLRWGYCYLFFLSMAAFREEMGEEKENLQALQILEALIQEVGEWPTLKWPA